MMSQQNIPKSVLEKMLSNDFFSQWLGIECVNITQGNCELKMKVRKEMLNGFGILHGGVIFSLADSVLAFAANSYGKISLTIEANISFLESVSENDELFARATEIGSTNKLGIYDVLVYKKPEQKIALFRGTVYRTSQNHFE